jgi:hypothetical protein
MRSPLAHEGVPQLGDALEAAGQLQTGGELLHQQLLLRLLKARHQALLLLQHPGGHLGPALGRGRLRPLLHEL